MKSSFDKLDEEMPEPSNEQAEPPKIIDIFNKDLYITRTAKIMITMPPQNNDDKSPDDFKNENSSYPVNEYTTGDSAMLLTHIPGGREKSELLFYGTVKDDDNNLIEGATVMVLACYGDGTESPFGYTFTDGEGTYIVNIPRPDDYTGLEGFKVLAGKGSLPQEGNDYLDGPEENPYINSSNKGFYDFLKLISNNPGKTIFELIKKFY